MAKSIIPLSISHPGLAAQWHPTRNDDLTPDTVVAGSHKKFWWKCPEGTDHEWPASLKSRKSGSGCPCCSGYQVSVTNSPLSSCAQPSVCVNALGPGTIWARSQHAVISHQVETWRWYESGQFLFQPHITPQALYNITPQALYNGLVLARR